MVSYLTPDPQSVKLVAVSDIHIITQDDDRAKALRELLKQTRASYRLEYLVLLGDIFDFYFGRGSYFEDKFQAIKEDIALIAQMGTKVIYLQGNHEFGLEHASWPGVEFVTDKTYVAKLQDGREIALTHGDLLFESGHYKTYLKLVRSQVFIFLVSLLPQGWLDRLCLAVSKASRKKNSYRRLAHRLILTKALLWQQSTGCRWAIMGHFHVAYNYLPPGKKTQLLCMDEWQKPNALLLAQDFYRLYWRDGKEPTFKRLLTLTK